MPTMRTKRCGESTGLSNFLPGWELITAGVKMLFKGTRLLPCFEKPHGLE